MFAQMSETFFSPMVLLWLAASAVAIVLLLGASGDRRNFLVETLREHVRRHQQDPKPNPKKAEPGESESSAAE
jgi:hypothetical protein